LPHEICRTRPRGPARGGLRFHGDGARRRFRANPGDAGTGRRPAADGEEALPAPEEEAKPATDRGEDTTQGNEIVVTATKREQTLQDVPVAVTVTSAQTLERAQIRDLKDLASVVPSLRVNQQQSSANTNFIIRGFGNGANNAGIEPSVGVFVDGVYRSRSAAQIGDFPDVQRIEVLRGPQSTLFGKNASAGVVSVVTQAPQFKFGGNLEATYGNYDAVVLKGVVTGPVADNVAVSLAGGYNKRDGYIHDLGTGHTVNDRNRWFVRGQTLWEASRPARADHRRLQPHQRELLRRDQSPAFGRHHGDPRAGRQGQQRGGPLCRRDLQQFRFDQRHPQLGPFGAGRL
jgi:outer membrane receptor protein involved in Fe transport